MASRMLDSADAIAGFVPARPPRPTEDPAPRIVAAAAATVPPSASQPAAGYLEGTSHRWKAAVAVGLLHVVAIAGLLIQREYQQATPPEPMIIVDLAAPAPPPPSETVPPPPVEIPPVVIPPPVVTLENPPPSITAVVIEKPPMVAPAAPPVQNIVATPAPSTPAPPVQGPVSSSDLATTLIEGQSPRYPYESRRLKETGTVLLLVTVGLDGRVAAISIRESSGHARLDEAALQAVRHWRWKPHISGGEPRVVKGVVEIPFQLRSRR